MSETSDKPGMRREVRVGRRVVTGFDSDGKSIISMDGPIPEAGVGRSSGRLVNWVWRAKEVPSPLGDASDPMETYVGRRDWPAREGYLVGIFRWEPGSGYPMHTTPTIDVGFVLSGHIELIVERGSTVLGPGDCCVMRGTPHAWRVVGDEPCISAALMVAGK